MQITQEGLVKLFEKVKGATPVSMLIVDKEGKPKNRVNAMAGIAYEAAVNRQRSREGNDQVFVAATRSWGKRRAGTPLVDHKDNQYLETMVLSSCSFEDGAVDPGPPQSQQGVQSEIKLRDFRITGGSIAEITFKHQTYQVVG